MKMKKNVIELIGNTPLVNLEKIDKNVYVKLENKNPGGSIKDRAVLGMILGAEEKGLLKAGDRIVEATSGNTGIATAMIGKSRGYQVTIIMPESMSVERRSLIKAYGAELILTEAAKGMQGSIDKMQELLASGEYKSLGQFDNRDNPDYHYKTTGPEIYSELKDVDIFVAGIGTGGTVSGISHTLKKNNPAVKVYAVEANESAVLSGEKPGPHKIQGISAGFIPNTLDTNAYDGVRRVSSEEAFELARAIGGAEGFLVGISSAAAIYAAIEVAKELGSGKKVLALAPDNGERYLSTTLYEFE